MTDRLLDDLCHKKNRFVDDFGDLPGVIRANGNNRQPLTKASTLLYVSYNYSFKIIFHSIDINYELESQIFYSYSSFYLYWHVLQSSDQK